MPRSSKDRIVKKRMADGTIKEYRYRRAGGVSALDPQSILALLRAYQSSPEFERLSPSSVDGIVRYLAPLLKMGSMKVTDVRRKHLLLIRDAIATRRGHGAASAFARAASGLFSWAVDREWLEHSPATRMRVGLRAGHLPTWTIEQAERAIRDLPEPYRRVVVLALHTGQRRGDLCAMRWSAYDGHRIAVTQGKTGRVVSVPVVPDLKAELDAWKREARGMTVLDTKFGRPWIPGYLSRTLPDEMAKIGLPRHLNVHGLRKLAAVRLAQAGCSTHEIAAITGHRTLAMVQLYTEAASQVTLSDAAILKLQRKPTKTRDVTG